MKLNTKRTILVGFAFFSICAFWQMYDNLIPKILTETFHIGESARFSSALPSSLSVHFGRCTTI